MSDAPYRANRGAPLELEVDLGGSSRHTRYHLSDSELRIESVAGSVPPQVMKLADVARVRLATLGGTTVCTLQARDGAKLSLSSGMNDKPDPAAARAFATILEALNERIATASPQAVFVTGSWWLGGGLLVMALIGGGALALLANDPLARETLKFKIGCVLLAVMLLVAVPVAFIRGRPRSYDPRKLPRRYDPLPPD
jgi:hypothetical protein